MAILNFCIRLEKKPERRKLYVDLNSPVQYVRELLAKAMKTGPEDFELICLGRHLKADQSLKSYGIKPGMTVHVLHKLCPPPPPRPPNRPSEQEMNQLIIALRTALMNPLFRNMVQQLSKQEALESVIAATPGLAEDPVAIAMLQDPDLLLLLADPAHIQRVVELHPSLPEAATHVVAAFHEEASTSRDIAMASYPTISYSLDALSDDEDIDLESDQRLGMDSDPGGPITPAQLANALAVAAGLPSAEQATAYLSPGPSSSHLAGHPMTPPPHSFITTEMISHAVQQALGTVSQPNLQSQVQQLRDMGITDDSVSIRALEVTGGDVQAALELIFGEFTESGILPHD